MSEFEFLAVLLSIVFGLALTQVLSGAIGLLYRDSIDDERLAWALFVAVALIVNWWGFFRWSDTEGWTFGVYAFLMMWATCHYVLAASLFPHTLGAEIDPEKGRRVFLATFVATLVVDVLETVVRDDVFRTPLYLPVMSHWALLALYLLVARRRRAVSRGIAWYMFMSVLAWSLLVRRLLAA